MSGVQDIRNRISGETRKAESIESIINLMRELSGVGDLIGRDFEVFNPEGELVFTVHQKAISSVKLNILLKHLAKMQEREKKEMDKARHKRR